MVDSKAASAAMSKATAMQQKFVDLVHSCVGPVQADIGLSDDVERVYASWKHWGDGATGIAGPKLRKDMCPWTSS